MYFKNSFNNLVFKSLSDYIKKNPAISRCYIRHSSAHRAQNPFLSDYDLAIFVKVDNFHQFQITYKRINQDFKDFFLLNKFASNPVILPDTENTYKICKVFYPFRSVYPMESWLLFGADKRPQPAKIRYSLPLDHAPENGLFYYVTPILRGRKSAHPLSYLITRRLIKKDLLWTGAKNKPPALVSFYRAILIEINIWEKFYQSLNYPGGGQDIVFKYGASFDCNKLANCLRVIEPVLGDFNAISSIWAYPGCLSDDQINLAVNFKPAISVAQLRKSIGLILNALKGLNYNLLLGREITMIGRINGLSRVSIIEPWLFKYYGCCLFGNSNAKEFIIEPSRDVLKVKYQEFLLYFAYGCLARGVYGYNFYKLCFVMDYLFKNNEIILDENRLKEIYGAEFMPKTEFVPQNNTDSLLIHLKNKHNFSIFVG